MTTSKRTHLLVAIEWMIHTHRKNTWIQSYWLGFGGGTVANNMHHSSSSFVAGLVDLHRDLWANHWLWGDKLLQSSESHPSSHTLMDLSTHPSLARHTWPPDSHYSLLSRLPHSTPLALRHHWILQHFADLYLTVVAVANGDEELTVLCRTGNELNRGVEEVGVSDPRPWVPPLQPAQSPAQQRVVVGCQVIELVQASDVSVIVCVRCTVQG